MCILLLLFLLFSFQNINGQVLTPPYFNLAEGRRVATTSTCGEGVQEPELYCKLVGANAEKNLDSEDNLVIKGQVCDHCDPSKPDKRHPAEYAVDGRETWWQSPPLSRGMKYNEVNLTIDLGQEFHVAYVIVKMGNSPRPGVWILERSSDNGQTYQPWQYFANTVGDCQHYFGGDIPLRITEDNTAICDTQFSKIVPLEGGEIIVPLVQNRPSANDFFNSTVLQEWTRATNVRFRFLRVKNLLGHLMSVARQDPTTTRRYFYSVKDISIGGRCRCNGHADTCDIQDPNDIYKLICRCQHNTCGHNCEICCPGFVQKKWSQSKSNKLFECERCNCNGHSDQCVYNETIDQLHLSMDMSGKWEGGGVCQNCLDHTEGINCDKCVKGFFQPYEKLINETDVCQPCQCDYFYSTGSCFKGSGKCECKEEFQEPSCDRCSQGHYGYPNCRPCECYINGTEGSLCEAEQGQCPCKHNFGGKFCKQCAEGFYNFPECKPCECNIIGSNSEVCDLQTGECKCKNSFGGRSCDKCTNGYHSFPSCLYCNCDVKGTTPEVCDKSSGKCICKNGYGGVRCDQCIASFTGFPDCSPCNCSTVGSALSACDVTGKCPCISRYAGKKCDQCTPGFYQYPDCLPCNCDNHGTIGVSCDYDGKCKCKPNFDGPRCDQCKEGYYNKPICEECNFDPAGVISTFSGCSSLKPGEPVQCKLRVQGKICNQCKELYWNLQARNPDGCQECDCNTAGSIGRLGSCDSKSGQCICKAAVTSRRCDKCKDGYYNLNDSNLFGCTECDCDIGGSTSEICGKESGQCVCQPRITGRTCKEPLQLHYFPTLHQYQYEVEDGHTPAYTAVRYGFDEAVFPGFSWKGYAVFSQIQNEAIQEVMIDKPSIYRMILRYVNPGVDPVIGSISAWPEYPNNVDTEQKFQVLFKPIKTPSFVTVAGIIGNMPSPFVLNPGPWVIKISTGNSNLFLDYFVLIPAAFYEAELLEYRVLNPCKIGEVSLCRHYQYPTLAQFDHVNGNQGYLVDAGDRKPIEHYFTNQQHLKAINVNNQVPVISNDEENLNFEITITSPPGQYVLVINYITENAKDINTTVLEIIHDNNAISVTVYPCKFTTICRQVATDLAGKVAVYQFNTSPVVISIKGTKPNAVIGIESVAAIPLDIWSLDYIQPKASCVMIDGKCIPSEYFTPTEAKRFDFKIGNENWISKVLPSTIYDNTTELIYLNYEDRMVDVTGKMPSSGVYQLVVHYYQPDFPEFDMDVLVHNGQTYEGRLPVKHCPSISGCRSVVEKLDGDTHFFINESFLLTLKEPNHKSIWVHYLLVVDPNTYSEKMIIEEPFDQTSRFITQCGHNSFYLNTSEPGFCADSTFSLTTAYNHGALPCHCDFEGSLSLECEKFGGQCPCRENVIGRRCDSCRTGYFGFPYCKSCNCPFAAYCDMATGDCICAPNVMGEKCNQCKPYTFGYHPIIGCRDCGCNIDGVLNNDLQCNLFDGSCRCKDHVGGQMCDRCVSGYWSFPKCDQCECDIRGVNEEICNQTTSSCLCKENVQGNACDVCKEGTFNLQIDNEEGCTKCFCFGKTPRCTSSTLFRSQITNLDKWQIGNINTSHTVEIEMIPLTLIAIDNSIKIDMSVIPIGVTYFVAPSEYLGNRLSAYGGFISYTIYYTTGPFGGAVGGADIILYGADMYLFHHSIEQPAAGIHFSSSVKIVENNFASLSGRASREELMQVLQNLTAIYIRGVYWESTVITRMSNISFEIAIPEYYQYSTLALSVEQCNCPPNYSGLSCEECSDGYYRAATGPFGGYCVPCQCNGHANTCDKITGICQGCKHNTSGDHCEKCDIGFYGNATVGTPDDCLICACPLPIASNNFASGCEINEDGKQIHCECTSGYYGSRCESCAPGYYGSPQVEGEFCKPCACSGNINPNEVGSCDSVSGKCMKCLNNTFGETCNICAPGYFGDAISQKDCQSCFCDKCGMEMCDHTTGTCTCRENVTGEKCDRCEDLHYGFSTCKGCSACSCGLASESMQCDDLTGQCRCKPGVTGRMCDKCASGFWQYTPDGCTSCGCSGEYSIGVGCNPDTGRCECLPGVIGEKCNSCPYRWVFVPGQGCLECDTCTSPLLDVTDNLTTLLAPVVNRFQTVAAGYFTSQRLIYINNSIEQLKPNVSDILSYQFDLSPFIQKIDNLSKDADIYHRKVRSYLEDSLSAAQKGELTLKDAIEVGRMVEGAIEISKGTVHEINNLAFSLETGTGPQTDYALKEGQRVLEDIENAQLDQEKKDYVNEKEKDANQALSSAVAFAAPLDKTSAKLANLHNNSETVTNKLDELLNHTDTAQRIATETLVQNNINKNVKISEKIKLIEDQNQEVKKILQRSGMILENATKESQQAKENFQQLGSNLTSLNKSATEMGKKLSQVGVELEGIPTAIHNAVKHAEEMSAQAKMLDSLSKDSRVSSDTALKAANAYKNIDKAVEEAAVVANLADSAATNTIKKSEGLSENVQQSGSRSSRLLEDARFSLEQVQRELEPNLSIALKNVKTLADFNKKASTDNTEITGALSLLKLEPTEKIGNLNAEQVIESAKKTLQDLNDITVTSPENLKRAIQLSKDQEDKRKFVQQAHNQLNKTEFLQPEITSVYKRLSNRPVELSKADADVQGLLSKLKNQIALSKDLANRIKVGVAINSSSSLELRVPSNLQQQAVSSLISLFFKTDQLNGILFYLGNEADSSKSSRRTKRKVKNDDFIALEIDNGYPVLTIDLGSGPTQISSNKYVSDNNWYQAVIERTGKNVWLKIIEDLGREQDHRTKPYVTEKVLPGYSSVLNVDKMHSRLFVGGFPMSFNLQPIITQQSFNGRLEEFIIGDTPIGFWNFVDIISSDSRIPKTEAIGGSKERDQLVNMVTSTGYRFNGIGYVILNSGGYQLSSKTDVLLHFKSSAPEGLLFLAHKDDTFLSIELRYGHVMYQYDVGKDLVSLLTSEEYNDDEWHIVEISRWYNTGILKVDGVVRAESAASDPSGELQVSDKLYIGGYPGEHKIEQVTKVPFDGCIDQVQIDSTFVDLTKNINAFGVNPGCPGKFASFVSFEEGSHGYFHWPNATSTNNVMELIFRFKTKSKDGLLVYGVDGKAFFLLLLKDGGLVFKSGGQQISSTNGIKYNDDDWHAVMAVHDQNALELIVDDYEVFKSETSPSPMRLLHGSIYFGSVPASVEASAAIEMPFVGCIGDATLNGVTINFGNASDFYGATIGKCTGPPQKTLPKPRGSKPPITSYEESTQTTKPTTIPTTVLPTPAPTPVGLCGLPLYPAADPDITPESGLRFGTKSKSGLKFDVPIVSIGQFEFSIEFKTIALDGILLISGIPQILPYSTLSVVEGKIKYTSYTSSDKIEIISENDINDGEWHTLEFTCSKNTAKLIIDTNKIKQSNTIDCSSITNPFYLGGATIIEDFVLDKKQRQEFSNFKGCLRNFKFNKNVVEPVSSFGVIPCSSKVESGAFFSANGGYIKGSEKFTVGKEIDIKLEIKPRNTSGLLVSAHHDRGKDYLMLQMINGDIKFTVDNGQGIITTVYKPPTPYYFCDGSWHSIQAVKTKNVVTLSIDTTKASEPGIGSGLSLDVNLPLFIGGHPSIAKLRGKETSDQFAGCIRNLDINNRIEDLSSFITYGDVTLSVCPTN